MLDREKRVADGSSPRGRGTPGGAPGDHRRDRFIPAWAGNTRAARWSRDSTPVHPRVGGEHEPLAETRSVSDGSSPRGRGTHGSPTTGRRTGRFIPAWAGNTHLGDHDPSGIDGSSRVGGEHRYIRGLSRRASGSSPRGRGTRRLPATPAGNPRFIPAWAGNTCPSWVFAGLRTVHPRVGGEHPSVRIAFVRRIGSSPRGRGTQELAIRSSSVSRFIPAWAGNTGWFAPPPPTIPVHPRVGGEHRDLGQELYDCCGSSPRGRGTPGFTDLGLADLRFIPAWAGNTLLRRGRRLCGPVHPRVGGEHSSHNALNQIIFLKTEKVTEFSATFHASGPTPLLDKLSPVGNGRNRTSFMPSTSTGIRRFRPQVSKS